MSRSTRHLLLLTDVITCDGVVTKFIGRDTSGDACQLLRMSFENATYITIPSSVSSYKEKILSPTARIIHGGRQEGDLVIN